jgi:hypothetical protein
VTNESWRSGENIGGMKNGETKWRRKWRRSGDGGGV